MDKVIEVRYAGIVVGQASAVRDHEAGGVFVAVADPLPVGTILSLKIEDHTSDGRVEHVVESSDLAQAGMRIRFVDNRAAVPPKPQASATPTPTPVPTTASAAPAASAPPAAPVAVIDSPSQASVPYEEAGEGESERIAAPPGLAGSDPQQFQGGGGRRRRRRR